MLPQFRRKLRSQRPKRPSARRLQIEPLEDRVLLSLDLVGQWNGGQPSYSDGWVIDNLAFIGHYGNNSGVHIIDVTDQANPFETARIPIGDIRDLEVQWQYFGDDWHLVGYFSSDIGNGLYIWDVSDPYNPYQLARITSAQGGTNTVHTLSVEGDWLYEADSRTANVRVFNVSDPANPRWVRNITSAVGDSIHEVTAQWGRLYTAGIWGRGSGEIWDVSQIGEPGAPVTFLGVAIAGPQWAHTTWPSDDGNFMAIAREAAGGELSFWDISNPAAPQRLWEIRRPTSEAQSVHQVMIRENLLFASWYQAGIYVYDISDPYNPVEVGSYDTFPGPASGYNGAWGVFGYWYDNRVFGFDMQSGMFIFNLNLGGSPGSGGGTFAGSGSRAVRGAASEGRDVSSFTPAQIAQLDADVLTLTLGAGDDNLVVRRSADGRSIDVVINDAIRFSYAANQVRRLNVRALEGNDRIDLDPNLNLHLFIDGGPGDDVVLGWSEAYVNPPLVHQGSTHAPKVTRYSTLGVETVVNSPAGSLLPRSLDYSAHQLIEHAETTETASAPSGLFGLGHGGENMVTVLNPSQLGGAHNRAQELAGDHLYGVLRTQAAWHKPWCY